MKIKNFHLSNMLAVFILLIASLAAHAQGWERTYLDATVIGLKVKEEPNTDLVVFGYNYYDNMFMLRTDAGGHYIDTTFQLGKVGYIRDERMNLTSDGGLITVISNGQVAQGNNTDEDFFMIKRDGNGIVEWTVVHGDTLYNEKVRAVIQTSDGGYLATGSWRVDTLYPPTDIFLIKTDANGNLQWKKTYGNPFISESGGSIAETQNGDIIIAGSNANPINPGAFLMKVNAQGDSLWTSQLGGGMGSEKVMIANNGDIYVGGDVRQGTSIPYDYNTWLAKTDDQGNELWRQVFDPPNYSDFADFHVTPDGGIAYLLNAEALLGWQNIYLKKLDANGSLQWEKEYGGALCDHAASMTLANDGGYLIIGGANAPDCEQFVTYLIRTDSLGQTFTNLIEGFVILDENDNCQPDPSEAPLEDWMVLANDNFGTTYYRTVDQNGYYSMGADTGTYQVRAILANELWENCIDPIEVVIANQPDTVQADFPINALVNCPRMEVSLHGWWYRPCEPRTIHGKYSNTGTTTAEDATLQVILDEHLTLDSASLPILSQVGDTIVFDLGDVPSLETGSFHIYVFVDCDPTLMGQYLCNEAHIFPDSLCIPEDPLWSGASIKLNAECIGDSVYFEITNCGLGNMAQQLEYIVIEDHAILMTAPFQLNAGESHSFTLAATGAFYRLETPQAGFHPGWSNPSAFVEACGNGNFSLGFVEQYPLDDENPYLDIDCDRVVGSWDPNDKSAEPIGYEEEHFIEANSEIEYTIRFQNTGTDTAFQVVLIDTLSPLLDIAHIRPQAASHSYDFDVTDEGILRFRFDDIVLPDSNVNEPASHGFVTFTIPQQRDLPAGTVIYNSAAIYFDFNPAVITNRTWHTIGEDYIFVDVDEPIPGNDQNLISVYPNPFGDRAIFEIQNKDIHPTSFVLYNQLGQVVRHEDFIGHHMTFYRNDLADGVYYFQIKSGEQLIGSGKLVAH